DSSRRTLAADGSGYADPVTVLDAAFWAICLVLVTSGAMKMSGPAGFAAFIEPVVGRRLAPTVARIVGVFELGLGFIGLAFGGRITAGLVALTYALFAVVVIVAIRRALPSCGCFGSRSAPPSGAHATANLISVLVAAVATARSTPGMAEGLEGLGLWVVPTVLGVLLVAVLVVVVDTRAGSATFAQRKTPGG
ncbi:MAG TPA: MauE/DoxX family redox-associated membrane protein, partial [Microthrixaceae bacterium]|nr:MauE/DoxX family redox-associated membrane protein [Microthrixaceae bacterium]